MQPSSHRESSRALGRGAVLCAFSVVSAALLLFIWACAGGGGGGGGGALPLPVSGGGGGGGGTVPIAPTLQPAVAADSQVTLSWPSVSDAISYNLYYGTATGVTTTNGTPHIGVTSPHTHTGLINGTPYYFVLTAVNAAGESVISGEVSATPVAATTPPSAPTLDAPTAGDGQVTLTWSPVAGATSYNLYYGTSAGVTTTTGTAQTGVTSPHAHTGLTNGTPYYFVLTSVNAAGESAVSGEVSATPVAATSPPSAPTLNAPTAGDGQVTLTWSPVSGATSYNLYYGTTAGVTTTAGTAHTGVTNPHTHTGLSNGTPYYYRLTAVNAAGESPTSNEISATPVAATAPPSAPTLNAPTAGDGQVTLTWSLVSGATSYNLYYGISVGVTTTTGTAHTGVTSPHTHTGLTNGTTYYFVLTAVNAAGESAISGEVNATPIVASQSIWMLETNAAPWGGRNQHTTVVFNNKIWVIGGFNGLARTSEVWSSTDGVGLNWTQITATAQWSARNGHTSVVFNGAIYVLGGKDNVGYLNDVWSSTDGMNWTRVTVAAQWSARGLHTSVVFNNKIWVMGGWYDPAGNGNGVQYRDVWSSLDGQNWILENGTASWQERWGHASVVFNNKMWVIGGDKVVIGSTPNLFSDVWSSSDGINWSQVISGAWKNRAFHTSTVFNSKIWIIGGYTLSPKVSDIWSSSDGINWVRESSPAPWSTLTQSGESIGRSSSTSASFNGKLFMIGGTQSANPPNPTDIWSFQ